MTNSRKKAFDILSKIIINKSYSNVLLNNLDKNQIFILDINLIFAIVHGTVSYKLYFQYLTKTKLLKNNTPIEIQIIIWMSLYQIKFLSNIPSYAVVSEAVNIAKEINLKFGKLVNACLQNVLRDESFFDVNEIDEDKKLCIENGFPFNLFNRYKKDYGFEIAKRICLDSNVKPKIWFRVNTLKIDLNSFYEQYKDEYGLEKSDLEEVFASNKPIVRSNLYTDGLITIQDYASSKVAKILNPIKNSSILDMCSAPGGKLTHLSAITNDESNIDAYEISENKISLIKENIVRLGIKNINVINADALKINNENKYDYILLDAPCSGFGVIKRKPEIKFNNTNFSEINKIVDLQAKLLDVAYKNLKVNGILVYSTCSINLNENQKQIEKFVLKYPDINVEYEEQIFGYENNTDGFYICKMTRK